MLLFSFFIVSPTQFNQAQYEENKIEQSLVTKTDVSLYVFVGWVCTVENVMKTPAWT